MGSSRLPGKVMKNMAGKPMIDWIIQRMSRSTATDEIIVATSKGERDDSLAEHLERQGVAVYRGDEMDVLKRYCECSRQFELTHTVRLTGDNPLVDTEEIDRLVKCHLERASDYSSHFISGERGLPVGLGGEIFSAEALEISERKGKKPHHREHVNEYILENLEDFAHCAPEIPFEKQSPKTSFTVDTQEEFSFVEGAMKCFFEDHKQDNYVTTEWLIKYTGEAGRGSKL